MPSSKNGLRVRVPLERGCDSVRQYAYHAISCISESWHLRQKICPGLVLRSFGTTNLEDWARYFDETGRHQHVLSFILLPPTRKLQPFHSTFVGGNACVAAGPFVAAGFWVAGLCVAAVFWVAGL